MHLCVCRWWWRVPDPVCSVYSLHTHTTADEITTAALTALMIINSCRKISQKQGDDGDWIVNIWGSQIMHVLCVPFAVCVIVLLYVYLNYNKIYIRKYPATEASQPKKKKENKIKLCAQLHSRDSRLVIWCHSSSFKHWTSLAYKWETYYFIVGSFV